MATARRAPAPAPYEATTPCPHCGCTMTWLVTPIAGGEQVELVADECGCPLTEAEWDDAMDQAAGWGDWAGDHRGGGGDCSDDGITREREWEPA